MRRRTKWLAIPFAFLALGAIAGAAVLSRNAACPAVSTTVVSAADSTTARAYTYACYGGPEVIRAERIDTPTPADSDVVVRVRAASVNPLDWHYLRGEPYVMRLSSGLGAPTEQRIGADFAGTVQAVGARVTEFRIGDRVFGVRTGAFATHVVVREGGVIAHIPDSVSFDAAAAAGVAAITALQAIRDKAQVRAGQRVLINGASGGVGTFAVQIAKIYGAHVTGVASTRNMAMVKSLGADHAIDYTQENFTTGADKYDAIIDMVGNHPLRALDGVLSPSGVVVIVGGPNANAFLGPLTRLAMAMIAGPILKGTFTNLLASETKSDAVVLRNWMAEGKLRSVIDRVYPFAELPAAIAYQEAGRSRGKVIVQMP